jgi:transcription elongation factor Elf1
MDVAKRRSKWRRTSVIMKKLMQEAKKTKAYQSIRQCPVCGDPHGLSIAIVQDKEGGKKQAHVKCSSCKFEYMFEAIPAIADEFWVYSKLLDMVYTGTISKPTPVAEEKAEEVEIVGAEESAEEPEEVHEEEAPEFEVVEEE